uniref:Guanylate cyclase n=1 Tax=Acrobeloides nanus TaxID=290746 RepID=A0A914E701_9BILA
MPKAEAILDICRKELWNEGILSDDFDIDIMSAMGCGEAFEGVAVAADFFYQRNAQVFIGPYCNSELDAVAKMAAYWNVPIIGYMASNNIFADKNIYKTLARVSLRTTNSLALSVASLLNHYGWRRVAIVTNTGGLAFERTSAFEEIFHQKRINVVKKVMFDEFADSKSMISSGYIDDLKNNARIIICMFSSTRELSKEFMSAVHTLGYNTHEYVYILPWLQAESKDLSPWVGADGKIMQDVKDTYANSIIIDDINGFDNTLVTPFKERVEANGITTDQLNMANIYGYIHLYDALKLYALAARTALNETMNPNITVDGRFIWNKMRRLQFSGLISAAGISSGLVTMDDLGERAGVYGAFYVSPNRDEVSKTVEMIPYSLDNCDGVKNKSGCFELKVNDVITGFWPSPDSRLPPEEPACGFRNERCDYTLYIILGILAILFVFAIIAALFLYRILENRALAKTTWRVFRDDMRVISEEEMKSMLSIGSSKTKMSNIGRFNKHHAIIGTNTHASFHMYPQRRPIKFNREDMQTLNSIKQAVHDNLNPFLGMAFNEKEEMLLLWKFCSRGTVQDIIYNDEVALDAQFHAAFVRDITLGLEYLHLSPIGYHGSLSPWSCLIDRNWMVKLTDYGIANPLERWTKQGSIGGETLKGEEDKSGALQATSVLYCSPEMLKTREQNRRRGTQENWLKQNQNRKQLSDIYSFGVVMYEILFRSLPYPEGTDAIELVEYLKDGSKVLKPSIQDKSKIHPDIASLLQDCWSANPELRPSIRRVRLNTEQYLKVKGSLVDQMMRMMEQYANNLEKIVQERTGMLEDANKRADKLLSQLLPAYVANELKMGRAVAPKMFKHASVLFTDIVGFTNMCASSTPLEVVTLLNAIYTGFDAIIARHDSYKVETIGDAYMVVSGIPQENGMRHLMHLADVSLELLLYLASFEVPHAKTQRVKIRIGMHTGAVATGVVGLTAPRYCLFGDTVNVASRMESTGQPEMIQVSEDYKLALDKHYPEFQMTLRGKTDIKGKGECTTYWLDDKKEENQKESFQPSKSKDETNELDQPSIISKIVGTSLRGINKGPPNPTSWNYVNKHFREDLETDMPLDEIVDGGGKILADETKKFAQEMRDAFTIRDFYDRKMYDEIPKADEVHLEFDFKTENSISQWRIGCDSFENQGYSKCELFRTDRNTAMFRGCLSNEIFKDGKVPRAGWATMKSNVNRSFDRHKVFKNWIPFSHLLIKCRGDGRSYKVMLYCPNYVAETWGDSYSFPLHTHGGPYWQYEKIPFSKFFFTVGGRIQDRQTPVFKEHIKAISIGIMDRIEGEFQMEIDYIGVFHDPAHTEKFAYESYVIPMVSAMAL